MVPVSTLNTIVVRRQSELVGLGVRYPYELDPVVTNEAWYVVLGGPPAGTDNADLCLSHS